MPAPKPIKPLPPCLRAELDALVRRHRLYLTRQARRLCKGNRALAEDLVQATMVEITRDYPKFDCKRAAFATWATLLLFRKWGDMRIHHQRHQAREVNLSDVMEECTGYAATGDAEREALSNLRCEELLNKAAEIGVNTARTRARNRVILRMRMDGYTCAEIARAVHCSAPLVAFKIRVIRQRMQERGRC